MAGYHEARISNGTNLTITIPDLQVQWHLNGTGPAPAQILACLVSTAAPTTPSGWTHLDGVWSPHYDDVLKEAQAGQTPAEEDSTVRFYLGPAGGSTVTFTHPASTDAMGVCVGVPAGPLDPADGPPGDSIASVYERTGAGAGNDWPDIEFDHDMRGSLLLGFVVSGTTTDPASGNNLEEIDRIVGNGNSQSDYTIETYVSIDGGSSLPYPQGTTITARILGTDFPESTTWMHVFEFGAAQNPWGVGRVQWGSRGAWH